MSENEAIKTCGECRFFESKEFICCHSGDEVAAHFIACIDFEPVTEQKPTNGDKIRQMSDEELAEMLVYIVRCEEDPSFAGWTSNVVQSVFETKTEAIAETIKELKRSIKKMNEEIKIDRLERIMEVAKMIHDDLSDRKLMRLARQASDIYATAKEEIEARSMLKEEAVKSPIEDEKDKVIARLKGNWDYLKEYLVTLRNSRLHNVCFDDSELNRYAITFLNDLIEKMYDTDNNVGSMEEEK